MYNDSRVRTSGDAILLLLALLGALQVLDGLMTYSLVGRGLVQEINPFIAGIAGEPYFLPMKFIGAIICGALLWWVSKRIRGLAYYTASILVLLYVVIIGWNIQVLVKLG
jgi:hypothetical protein